MSIVISSPTPNAAVSGIFHVIGATVQSINGIPLDPQAFDITFDSTVLPNGAANFTLSNGVDSVTVAYVVANTSADGLVIPDGGVSITDAAGVFWSIGADGRVNKNGSPLSIGSTKPIVKMLWSSGAIYALNSDGVWWKALASTPWQNVGARDPRLLPESVDGATIPSAAQIVDYAGDVWTVIAGVVKKNNVNAGYTNLVQTLLYYGGSIYQQNQPGNWYKWNGTNGYTAVPADPRAPAPTLSASGAAIAGTFQTLTGASNQALVTIKDGTTTLGTVAPAANGSWAYQVRHIGTGTRTLTVSAGTASPVVLAVTVPCILPAKIFYGANGHLAWGGTNYWTAAGSKTKQVTMLKDLGCTMYRADVADNGMATTIKNTLSSGGEFYQQGIGFVVVLNGYSMNWRPTMTEQASYDLTYQRTLAIATTLNGMVDYWEMGNELDQYIRAASGAGNGSQNSNWDQAGFVSCRGALFGMLDALVAVNPDFLYGPNIGIPMATAFLQMLWDGVTPDGTTGARQMRWKRTYWHWYASSGNWETAGSAPTLNIPQYLKDHFGVPIIMSEWGWASSSTEASRGGTTSTYLTQYSSLVNQRQKYGLEMALHYAMVDSVYGLSIDGTTNRPAYATFKAFVAANPV